MLVRSASQPRTAAPTPPIPNANPKNSPATIPTRLGSSSWAYTMIAENADARIRPIGTVSTVVQNRSAYGRATVNGRTPRIDPQMTALNPTRSPTGPPRNVPAATAPRNTNSRTCASATPTPNVSIRYRV